MFGSRDDGNMDALSASPPPAWLNDLGLEMPQPSANDAKWIQKCDKFFKRKRFKRLRNELKWAINSKDEFRVFYILENRRKLDEPEKFLSDQTVPSGKVSSFKFFNLALTYGNKNISSMVTHFIQPIGATWIDHGDSQNNLESLPSVTHIEWLKSGLNFFQKQAIISMARSGDLDAIKSIAEFDFDINNGDGIGLITAVRHQDLEFIKEMIALGASPFSNNKRAVSLAEELGKFDISQYLHDFIAEKRRNAQAHGIGTTAQNTTPHNDPQSARSEIWSIVSPAIVECAEPAGASGISLTHNINFDNATVTTTPTTPNAIGQPVQQQFNFFQKRDMIEKAHALLTDKGHKISPLTEVFQTSIGQPVANDDADVDTPLPPKQPLILNKRRK